jgi:hypothetical protein
MSDVNFVSSFIVIWYFINFHLLKLDFFVKSNILNLVHRRKATWRLTDEQLAYNINVADTTIKNIASSKVFI